jgi:hypothetical protein
MQYYSKYGTLNIEVYAQSESSSCGKEENIYMKRGFQSLSKDAN